MEPLPFALPDLGDEEVAEVTAALQSGWVTSGPRVKQFEQEFAAFIGGGVEAVAVSSATAGLHLALEAAGVGPGDEVITTTHTFTSAAQVIRQLEAKPVLVDIDPATLCIDPDAIEAAVTPRTKAIMPMHYGGRAAEMDRILDLARRHGLRVVEDAAHALPTTHRGTLIGALASDATVFSFYANKTMTTGDGGMLVTRDPAIAARARIMRLHGISRDAFDRYNSRSANWRYEVVAPGHKYNLTDVAAAIGLVQLRRVREMRQKRARIAEFYGRELDGLPLTVAPRPEPGDEHAWHLYAIRLHDDAPLARDAFIEAMQARGIGCSVHYIPLHRHPQWRQSLGLCDEMYPESQRAYESLVSLPVYSRMEESDAARVTEAVRALLTA
jgi:dTDP-4-amino-4,6-dideoxygalactose transaminase